MPVVTECDDSFLNDVTSFPLAEADVSRRSTTLVQAMSPRVVSVRVRDAVHGLQGRHRGRRPGSSADERRVLTLTNFGSASCWIDGVQVGREFTDLMPQSARRAPASSWSPRMRRWSRIRSGGCRAGGPRTRSLRVDRAQRLGRAHDRVLDPNRIPLASEDGTLHVRAILDGPGADSPDLFQRAVRRDRRGGRGVRRERAVHRQTTVGRDGTSYTRSRSSARSRSSRGTGGSRASRTGSARRTPRRQRRLALVLAPAADAPSRSCRITGRGTAVRRGTCTRRRRCRPR